MNRLYIANTMSLIREEVYKYYYDRVTKERQSKADRLQKHTDKALSVGASALLRFAISDCTDFDYDSLNFKTADNGKPYVEGHPFYFNISHSNEYAVCVISDTPVGVDIELDRPLQPKMQERFAKDVLEWTKKEAKGKLTGNGVFDKTEGDFIFSTFEFDGYIITVCSDKKADGPFVYHFPFPC